MNNKNGRVFISFILCLPVIIAIIVGLRIDPLKLSGGTLKTIEVFEQDAVTYSFEDEGNMKFYLEVTDSAKEIDHAVRDISGQKPVTVLFTEQDGTEYTYNFYLALDGEECYFEKVYAVQSDGENQTEAESKLYRLEKKDALLLLERAEFYSVYPNSAAPKIIVSSSEGSFEKAGNITDWNWKRNDGKMISVKNNTTELSEKPIKLGSATDWALSFNIQPDEIRISYSKNGSEPVLSDNDFAHLMSKIVYEEDTDIYITIDAKWYGDMESEYFGEATYTINALFDVPSTVNLTSKGLRHGGFGVVRLYNFNDDEQLVIESPLKLTQTPVFEYDGQKFAYVMIGCENPVGMSNITINGKKFDFEVRAIENFSEDFDTVNVTDDNKKDANTKESWAEYEELIIPLLSQSAQEKRWDGKFAAPLERTKTILPFAKQRFVSTVTEKYRHEAVDYEAKVGDSVLATNGGMIVFAGETKLLGNLIVVDHGYSIFSYYGHLSAINCEVGDMVDKQQKIGECGETGFAFAPQLHFAMSIGTSFIEPIHTSGLSFPA